MKASNLLIHSAIASLIAVSSLAATQAVAAEGKEKCYGVAKKGQNDCGTCEQIGGKLTAMAGDKNKEPMK